MSWADWLCWAAWLAVIAHWIRERQLAKREMAAFNKRMDAMRERWRQVDAEREEPSK